MAMLENESIFARYKSDKSNQRVYNTSDISPLDPNLSKNHDALVGKSFPSAREDHRSHVSVMGQRAYNLTSACQERDGGVTLSERGKKKGRPRERARGNERRERDRTERGFHLVLS